MNDGFVLLFWPTNVLMLESKLQVLIILNTNPWNPCWKHNLTPTDYFINPRVYFSFFIQLCYLYPEQLLLLTHEESLESKDSISTDLSNITLLQRNFGPRRFGDILGSLNNHSSFSHISSPCRGF